MSSPRPAVLKPSSVEFMKLVISPVVKIYVGDRAEPYVLPKDLLSYYSPYFRACFNGNFKEGIGSVLRLPEEDPKHFEVLIEHMRCGEGTLKVTGSYTEHLAQCFDFVKFVDRYDICEAAGAVKHAFLGVIKYNNHEILKSLLVFCFGRLHEDNPLLVTMREILAAKVLSGSGDDGELQELLSDNCVAGPVMRTFVAVTTVRKKGRRQLYKGDDHYSD